MAPKKSLGATANTSMPPLRLSPFKHVTHKLLPAFCYNVPMATSSQNTPKSNQDVAEALLQSFDPLMERLIPVIRVIIADYIIDMRRQLLSGDKFLTVRQAAKLMGVSVPTIYVWIKKEIINPVCIEDKIYVSISEVRFARDTIYQPAKATKKPGGKPKATPLDSKPQPRIEIRNGLPFIVHPEGKSQEEPAESSQ
jgi:hypothetical protein